MTPPPTNEDWFGPGDDERLLGHQPYDDLGSMIPPPPPSRGERRAITDTSRVRAPDAFIETGAIAGCMPGTGAILRLVNEIISESLAFAKNEAGTATFAASLTESHKS